LKATAQWGFQIVDDGGDVGRRSQIAVDSQGNPHAVYFSYDPGNSDPYQTPYYAHWVPGSGWAIRALPLLTGHPYSFGNYVAIAISSDDSVGVSYINYWDWSAYNDLCVLKTP